MDQSSADRDKSAVIVTVRDRSSESPWGSGLLRPVIARVEISANCPKCGAPRGEIKNLNSCDDGAYYSVSVWENPCGHSDPYVDVLKEGRVLSRMAV